MSIAKKARTALTVIFVSTAAGIVGGTAILQTGAHLTDAPTNPDTRRQLDVVADFAAVMVAGGAAYMLGRRRRQDADTQPQSPSP